MKHPFTDPTDPIVINGYPWPASALTNKDMAILTKWREKTGKPIAHLLKECIEIIDEIIEGRYGNAKNINR